MKFSELAKYLDKLERTSSRISITEILAELFNKASVGEIDKMVYLLLGGLAPKYEGIVFNIADQHMMAAISGGYGIGVDRVKELYKKKGDLGDVAFELATKVKNQKSKVKRQKVSSRSSVSAVYDSLRKIAEDNGEGSVERKVGGISELLSGLDPMSAKFIARIPTGRLRLGFSDKTILDALSWMKKGDKSAKTDLEKIYFVIPDVGQLAKQVKKMGVKKAVVNPTPVVGVPILPMLAQRLKSPTEMIQKMGEVAIESKLDGLRIQIHYKKGPKGFTKTYTRNMNETSWMFPELKRISKYISANEVVLDTEAVGMSEDRKKLANFQTTMTRRRKHNIDGKSSKVPIKFYVFDILLKNQKGLLDKEYLDRRKILSETIKNGKLFKLVDYEITNDPKVITKGHKKKLKQGFEGIIVKRANSRYVAGRTGWRWVKMKEVEKAKAKLADTLDCVVMGYTQGRGKRVEFGIGQFLVGVRGGKDEEGKIYTVSKVGTGLTDDQFRELKRRLSKIETKKKPKEYEVHKDLEPDYWVTPSLVVEIAADEITKSPKHTSSYALRFPRLIRFRDDKSVEQATTISEIIKLYKLQ